jgi:hypothetical protein
MSLLNVKSNLTGVMPASVESINVYGIKCIKTRSAPDGQERVLTNYKPKL